MEDKTTKISRPLPPDDKTKVSTPPDDEKPWYDAVQYVDALKNATENKSKQGKVMIVLDLLGKYGLDELKKTVFDKVQELGYFNEEHSTNQPGTIEESLDRMKKLSGIK